MLDPFSRTGMLLGQASMEKLRNSKVMIFGIGGVGSHCIEAIARCGVGTLVLVDNDVVSPTNINRQVVALHSTIGKYKTQVMKERIADINPQAEVIVHQTFVLADTLAALIDDDVDFIVDAIDTVAAKIAIAALAEERGIPLISCMGTGNKLNPLAFKFADIYNTSMCPLCKVMRRELKKRGIKKLRVLYSDEQPRSMTGVETEEVVTNKRSIPGSISFVPPAAGILIASEVVKELALTGE